jgi:sarcosine oxidase gamma subunit
VPSARGADVAVIVVMAGAPAIDAYRPHAADGRSLRTAPDELLIVTAPTSADAARRRAEEAVAALDPDAVVMDVSDGWAGWRLDGDDAHAAFARLSALKLPDEGWVQGDVAHVAAKVVAEPGGVLILVPSYWGEHVRTRIVSDALATEMPA